MPFEPTLNKTEQYTIQNPVPAEEHVPFIDGNVIKNISYQGYPGYEHPHPRAGGSRAPGSAEGALDRTAEQMAKLFSGSEDQDVTALSETVRAEWGITEPFNKLAMASPAAGLTSLADDLKRARACRLLPKFT